MAPTHRAVGAWRRDGRVNAVTVGIQLRTASGEARLCVHTLYLSAIAWHCESVLQLTLLGGSLKGPQILNSLLEPAPNSGFRVRITLPGVPGPLNDPPNIPICLFSVMWLDISAHTSQWTTYQDHYWQLSPCQARKPVGELRTSWLG